MCLPHQEACGPYGWGTTALVSNSANLIPLDGLPPILTSTGVKGGELLTFFYLYRALNSDQTLRLAGLHRSDGKKIVWMFKREFCV